MKRQVSTRLQSTTTAEMKAAPIMIRSSAEAAGASSPATATKLDKSNSALRKTSSVDAPPRPVSQVNFGKNGKLSRAPSFDAGISPLRVPAQRPSAPKPITLGQGHGTKPRSPKSEPKSLYHTVSPELLSVSPLQPSPSMTLLNRTAEVLFNGDQIGDRLRRMPVRTTTQVFEVRKPISPGPPSRIARQESLLAVYKPATDEEDSLLVKSDGSFRLNAEDRALRERAAYVLDKIYQGFSHVPATALANLQSSKGSLQEYVRSNGTAEDNPELVGRAPAEEVQRIGILDCRILNLDRHSGNVLVTRSQSTREKSKSLEEDSAFLIGEDAFDEVEEGVKLTPIDHSLCLPPWRSLGEAWFDWCYWPQADESLTEETRRFVDRLDVNKDEKELLELGIAAECVATNRICTMALQSLVKGTPNITLRALAEFFQRPYSVGHSLHHIESPLEHLVNEACNQAKLTRDESVPSAAFYKAFEEILDAQIKDSAWRSFVV